MRKQNRRQGRTDRQQDAGSHSPTLHDVVAAAGLMQARGDHRELASFTDTFIARARRENLWSELSQVFADELTTAVDGAWQRGWQPADLAHVVGRRLQARHRKVCADAIGLEAQSYRHLAGADPRWVAQVDAVSDVGTARPVLSHPALFMNWTHSFGGLEAGFLGAVQTLALLRALPSQPRLCTPPSGWSDTAPRPAAATRRSRGADPKMIERVRALLAKAESTDFPDEAETFTAKAQELIARHAIDQALLEGGDAPDGTVGRRLLIDDPYGRAKAMLVGAIADANGCSAAWADQLGFCTVFGPPSDLDVVEILYASLLTQATAAMTAAARTDPVQSRARSFRQAFLVSFATRIGQRLERATATATEEARLEHGDNVLPVLASRLERSERARQASFPDLKSRRVTFSNYSGWIAGRVAADQARLGPEAELAKR